MYRWVAPQTRATIEVAFFFGETVSGRRRSFTHATPRKKSVECHSRCFTVVTAAFLRALGLLVILTLFWSAHVEYRPPAYNCNQVGSLRNNRGRPFEAMRVFDCLGSKPLRQQEIFFSRIYPLFRTQRWSQALRVLLLCREIVSGPHGRGKSGR